MKLSVSAYRAHASAHKKILDTAYQLNYGSTSASHPHSAATCSGFQTNAGSFLPVELSKNLELISKNNHVRVINMKLVEPQHKPLIVLLSWLLAKRRHIYKVVDYYTEYGFDVLRVSVNPWQVLWPTRGTQIIANDILKFLDANTSYRPLFLHGFSVGGYQWAEVLVQISKDQNHYQHILDKIVGQVWDSVVDVTEAASGFPQAVFPNNLLLQTITKGYMILHLRTFTELVTRHHIRSSQMFHSDLLKAPAMILLSKMDRIASVKSLLLLKKDWESLGIKVRWKCWDTSPHVSHFRNHREEYIELLDDFLVNVKLKV